MVECYKTSTVFRYEDFVSEPVKTMEQMCKALDMPFSDIFINTFPLENVTGDSGRTASIISPRPRREINKSIEDEVRNSDTFKIIAEKFNYDSEGI